MPTSEDIIDTFDTFNTYDILTLFNDIKEDCQKYGLNILDNTDINTSVEFVDLIKNNINLRLYHENKTNNFKKKS